MQFQSDPAPSDATGACPSAAALEAAASSKTDDVAVLAHLDACSACRAAVQEIRANIAFLADYAQDLQPAEEIFEEPKIPNDIIPGYRLLGEIHRGAQGIVYRAEQEHTKRLVAIKMLLQGSFATPRQRARFERETEIAAGLRHPNIVTVYDSTPVRGNRFALVMEYIEGVALDAWCIQDSPLRERVRLFAQVCEAVEYAHQRGVIHRDLKPANILVSAGAVPHVLDFGIAKMHEGGSSAGSTAAMTQPGEFAGTLAYASPEQLTGRPDLVDTRTDIYSLGVIFFEMLTGAMPYPVDSSFAEVIQNISQLPPGRPSDLASKVDDDLDTIVLRALCKEPEHRYQSVWALLTDVRHWLAGEPIGAKRDSMWYMLRMTVKRRKTLAAVAAASAVTVSVAITAAIHARLQRAEADAARAQAARSAMESEELRAANEFLVPILEAATPPVAQGRAVPGVMLQVAEERFANGQLANQPKVEAAVRMTLGQMYQQVAMEPDALRYFKRAYEIRLASFGPENLDTAASECAYGLSLVQLAPQDPSAGEALIRHSLRVRRRAAGENSIEAAASLHAMGLACFATNVRIEESRQWFKEAGQIRERLLGPTHADTVSSFERLALVNWMSDPQANAAAAEAYLRPVIARFRPGPGSQHPIMADCEFTLGSILFMRASMGEIGASGLVEAEQLLRECIELRRRLFGDEHPKVGIAWNVLGGILARKGDPPQAAAAFGRAAQVFMARPVPDPGLLGEAMMNQGLAELNSGNTPQASDTLTRAMEWLGKQSLPNQFALKNTFDHLQQALVTLGREKQLTELREQARKLGVPTN